MSIEADTFIVVGMLLAFGAGMISFLSPCVLPLFPAYLSYITGMSVKDMKNKQDGKIRRTLLSHSVFFLLGISLVFISLGIGASFLGQWLQSILVGKSGLLIQRLTGIFIIVMGLFVAGWITIPTLMREKRMSVAKKRVSYGGTFLVGMGFATGWTPCIGPIFASILLLAANQPGHGVVYTFSYVIGFALPFLLLTFFLGSTQWIVRRSQIIMKVGGVIMIIMGIVLFTGYLSTMAAYILDLIQGTWLENLG